MRVEQKTGSFEGHPVAHDEVDYAYYSASGISNGYTGSSSTTFATINLTRGSGAETYLLYLFDTSSIPDGAVVTNVSCIVKCYINQTNSARVATRQVQLFAGETAKGSVTTITNSTSVQTMNVGSWTLDELRNIRLRLSAIRGTSNTTTNYYFRFYGATLTVEYQIDQYYYTVDVSNTSSATVSPLGETEYESGSTNILFINDANINKIKVVDNGSNVTDQLAEIPTNHSTNISGYSSVSGTISSAINDLPNLVGKGIDSTSSVNFYSAGEYQQGSVHLNFDFGLPQGLQATDLYVRIKWAKESDEGDNTAWINANMVMSDSSTSISSSISASSTNVATNKISIRSGLNPADFYWRLDLLLMYGYWGGYVYGATAYLETAGGYVYSTTLSADHTIHVKDFAYYLKIAGAWADIKTIWVKRNGIWVIDKDYEFNNNTRYIQQNAFTQVEYLESTGTQYIELNIIPDAETGIYVKYTSSNNTDTYLAGLRETSGDTRWAIGHTQSGQYYGYGTWAYTSPAVTGLTAESYLNWMNNKKFISSDGTNTGEANLPTLSFTPTNKIRVFGSSGVAASYAAWLGKIYNVKVSQGSNIVLNLIPVKIGQTGYMYDTINNAFYGNMGTGDFTFGADLQYTPVDYLESSGTQYIELPCSADAGDYFSISGYMTPLHTTTGSGVFSIFSADIPAQFSSNFFSYNNGTRVIVYDSTVGTVSTNGGWTGVEYEKTYFDVSTTGRTYIGEFNELSRPLTASFSKLKIFGGFYQGGYPVRFHSLTIKKNNTILYDLVPVKVGQVGYMYDRVSGQLFGNQGTGRFVLGNDL